MIHSFPVPFSKPLQSVNTTVIFDDPLTIIDPGPRGQKNSEIIASELQKHGKSIKDLKRILLTHGHVDHFGIAEDLRQQSGALIYLHPFDVEKTTRIDERMTAYKALLAKHGCESSMLHVIDDFNNAIKNLLTPLVNPQSLPDRIAFEHCELEAIETPGHTWGSVVFYERQSQVLISGDTVIKKITPNPIVEFVENGQVFHSLVEFKKSIEKLKPLPYSKIIPGHGEAFADFLPVYDFYQKNWETRENEITTALQRLRRATAVDVARSIFKELNDFNLFLAVSEVIGYFDLLKCKDIIEIEEAGGILYGVCQ